MKVIYKIEIYRGNIIEIPEDFVILSAQKQNGKDYLWALVDTDKPRIKKYVECFGTGWDLEDYDLSKFLFVGTIQDGCYVWHYFIRNQ